MKLTKSQLKKIIKEELEEARLGSPTKTYKLRMYDGEYEHEIEVKGATSVETRSEEFVKTIVIDGKIEVDFPNVKSLDIVG